MTPPAASATRPLDYRTAGYRRRAVHRPRRVSGPARPAERMSSGLLLDRLIRGRLWIGLLAFALIGIVAMQLVVLKLNTGIGVKLQHEASLQRENAELGIENSVYSAESRIAPLAAATGMTFAPSGTVHFVTAAPDDFARAASALASAAQPSTSTQSEASEVAAGEASAATQSTTATGEAETSESSSSSAAGVESAGGSNETSSAANIQSGTAVPAAASPATAPASAATPEASAGEQASGASTGPVGGASAPADSAQAGPQG